MSKTRTTIKIVPPKGRYFFVEPEAGATSEVNWSDVDRVIEESVLWCGQRGWKRTGLWTALNWSPDFTNYVARCGSDSEPNLFDVELRVYVEQQ